jgi:uncharacterized protein (DUF2384 family)
MNQTDKFFSRKSAAKAAEIFGIHDWSNDLNLIRIYHLLSVLLGGSDNHIRHWFQTPNKHLDNKTPANLITHQEGTLQILTYLEHFYEH